LQFIPQLLQLVAIFFYIGGQKVSFAETFKYNKMKKFTLVLILGICSLPLFAVQSIHNKQMTAWQSIKGKFMGETRIPYIYRNDIAIKLAGIVNPIDSACMNELIDSLKLTIPNHKIYLTKDEANLTLTFNDPRGKYGTSVSTNFQYNSIKSTKIFFVPFDSLKKENQLQILYYYLFNALVHFERSTQYETVINGCVFDERSPERISYPNIDHSFDSIILKTLYSDDFIKNFKSFYISIYSFRSYMIYMYHNELDMAFLLLGLFISAILLSVLTIKGVFKPHNLSWVSYNKQALPLIGIGVIYAICIDLAELKLDKNDLSSILNLIVSALSAVNLIYITEKSILKNPELGGSKIILNFLITFIALALVSFPINLELSIKDIISDFPSRYISLLPYILSISLARALYIFINDRYKSIINQKDVELAQMNELHRQAELQSLRAKINPHFLYNALNSIASLATTDPQKTEKMALALSDFFKYAINREQKQFNSLQEELNAIRTYLEIEKVRFGDRLNFEIDCEPGLLDIPIPQLLIQPLVENAIKHGLSQITENGFIKVSIIKEEQKLGIRIYDNGPAFPEGPLPGFGIRNTQERIALLYGSKASMNWENKPEKFIGLSLPIENYEINQQ